MADFDLTGFDEQLIALAHQQGLIGRTYARSLDRCGGDPAPDELPEAAGQPNVRQMLQQRSEESSGAAIMDVLLNLEEAWGTIPFRKSSNPSAFLGNKLVELLGTPEQAQRWKDCSIAIALTEPDAGSDPSRARAAAVLDPATGEWVLNGEKIFISLGQACDAALVFARFDDGERPGMGLFVVDKGQPGFSVGPQLRKMGQRAWDTANLAFSDCRLPASSRLAGDMRATLSVFNGTRPVAAAIGLGFARACLDYTREVLTGAGLAIDYDAGGARQPARVADFMRLEAAFEAARLTLLHAKWIEQTQAPGKVEAAMTKADAGAATRRITTGCMKILGAEAASEEHLVEMWLRDARVCDIYEGPGEINRLIIARDFLGYSAAELS